MFNQYPFISAEHQPILESCIRHHPPLMPNTMARLYKAALEAITTPSSTVEQGTSITSFAGDSTGLGKTVIGTATDVKTGVYIQLSLVGNRTSPIMTLGKKWAAQGTHVGTGSTATGFYPD